MAFKDVAVFGIFKLRKEVESALARLQSDGFLNSDIIILNPSLSEEPDVERLQKTMIGSFAKVGSCVGGFIFLIFGLIAASGGILEGGVFTNTTFLMKALAVLLALFFGVLFGAASGALVGIGTPQPTLLRFGNYIDAGGTLLSVRVGDFDEQCRAKKSVELSGARDVNLLGEANTWSAIHRNSQLKLKALIL
jgi:hypothetical protein